MLALGQTRETIIVLGPTYLGEQVCDTSDDAGAANGQSRREPVALPGECAELLRVKGGPDASHLGDAAAGELDADNVGVLAQGLEHFRVYVQASCDAGEVVDDDGDGAGVGKL